MRAVFCLCIRIVFLTATAFGSCGSSSCPIELHGLTPTDGGRGSIDFSLQYIDQDQPRIGSRRARVGEIPSDHDEIRTINRIGSLQLNYASSERLGWTLTVPVVSRSHQHFDEAEQELQRWNFSGLGDAAVQGRLRLFQAASIERSSLWLTAGVKFPTGARHERDVTGSEEAEVTIQPGNGSTDVVLGLNYQTGFVRNTALSGPLGHATLIPLFASVTYRMNGRGTDEYRRGREVQLNLGTQYPLATHLDLLAQLNAREMQKDWPGLTGETPDLTGGRFLFLSPGARVRFNDRQSAYLYVQLPVFQHMNGIQLTAKANYLIGIQERF